MKKRAVIICQAGHEAANVLDLYEDLKSKYADITFVSNINDSYSNFFKLFPINAKYLTWETLPFSCRNPFDWKNWRAKLRKEVEMLGNGDFDFYYTCVHDPNLLARFRYFPKSVKFLYRAGKEMELCGNEGMPSNMKFMYKVKFRIIKLMTSYACKSWLHFHNSGSGVCIAFDPKKLGHTILPIFKNYGSIRKLYSYKPSCGTGQLAILFTEPYRNKFQTEENYNDMNVNIVNNLHEMGYKVVMKGHPRIGNCKAIENLVDEIIPLFVPSEFIDYTIFSIAIGFVSTSICNSSEQIPSYTVLDMCEIIDAKEAKGWHEYLDKNSDGKVKYLSSFDEIRKL